jgi:uncharacterized protein YoxC
MILEISIASIAVTLLIWVVCFVIFLIRTSKTIGKIDSLVSDIQSKSASLDLVFRPLKAIGRGKHSETLSEIAEWAGSSLVLFNKIKNAVKSRGNRRHKS